MLFSSYLYLVVGQIPFKQIKVMKLKAYLLLPKLEIQSPSPIGNLLNIEIPNLLDTSMITAGTGTTGGTTILTSGIHTTIGTNLDIGTIATGIIALIITLLALLLDRKLNRELDLDQELHPELNQNQKKIEQELE